jgi:hypothetical protein
LQDAKTSARRAAWRKANPGRTYAAVRKWRKANPEKHNAQNAAWRKANPDKSRASYKRWYDANPNKTAAASARRRARLVAAAIPLTTHEQADVIAIYAKARALTELTGTPYHVDHKTPLAKGGLHHPSNLQVLLGADNLRKGAR